MLNSGYSDLIENQFPSLHTAGIFQDGAERTYVVWQALRENASQESSAFTRQPHDVSPCDLQTWKTTPVICFREKRSSWQPLVMFTVINNCDRKPVISSWQGTRDRNVLIAYEGREGEVHYVWRDEGQWQTAATLSADGANPAVTAINGAPEMIYTDFQSAPHRVQQQSLSLSLQKPLSANTTLPHRRQVYFRLKDDLHTGGSLAVNGEITIGIGDPLLTGNAGIQPLSPSFAIHWSLVTTPFRLPAFR